VLSEGPLSPADPNLRSISIPQAVSNQAVQAAIQTDRRRHLRQELQAAAGLPAWLLKGAEMADKTHRVDFEITATDKATQVFKDVKGSVDGLKTSYYGARRRRHRGALGRRHGGVPRRRGALPRGARRPRRHHRRQRHHARRARAPGAHLGPRLRRLQGSLTKFAKNLNDTGDEGKNAAQAIEALGLNVEELRAMKPATRCSRWRRRSTSSRTAPRRWPWRWR
jgi:hypothetical protein